MRTLHLRKDTTSVTDSPQRTTFGSVLGSIVFDVAVTCAFLAAVLFGYEAWWTNIAAAKAQAAVSSQLDEQWANAYTNPRGDHVPALGAAFARIQIPSFGSDYSYTIVEGTNDDDLLAGPGHYADTQMPGEAGNFAVAGHRVGKGAPFNDLGNLETCDAIVIETQTQWFTYKVLPMSTDPAQRAHEASCLGTHAQAVAQGTYAGMVGRHITTPEDIGVIQPVPNVSDTLAPDAVPLLTLTTCHPQFSNAERMIIHASLVEVTDKHAGHMPAALQNI